MEISDFASHLLVGIKDMKKQSTKEKKIDEFLDRIGRKIMLFKSACGSRFVEFKMQDCISSLLDEERKVRGTYLFVVNLLNITIYMVMIE